MIFITTPFLRRFWRGERYGLHNQVSITSGKSSCAPPQRARPAGDHANGDRQDARLGRQRGQLTSCGTVRTKRAAIERDCRDYGVERGNGEGTPVAGSSQGYDRNLGGRRSRLE